MRNERLVVPFAILAMFGLAACDTGTNSDQQAAADREGGEPETQMAADTRETGQARQAQQSQGSQQSTKDSVALTVEESPQLGQFLADEQGRPVYMLEGDSGGESNCTDQCAQQWPPVIAASGQPSAEDPAIEESRLDTIQRDDGQQQVTYNGHPLYYYVQDNQMGEPSGQQVRDQWGEWYLLTAQGEPLEKQQSQSRGSSRK